MSSPSHQTAGVEDVLKQLQAGGSMPAELMEIFAEEAEDHLRTIYDGLNSLRENAKDSAALANVRRSSHTLKGAAGAVNLQAASKLAHRMEDMLDYLANQGAAINESQLELLLATADQLQEMTAGDFELESMAEQIVESYRSYDREMAAVDRQCETSTTQHLSASNGLAGEAAVAKLDDENQISPPSVEVPAANATKKNGQSIRVPLDRLDQLVSLLGEMFVNRSQFQSRLDEFESRIEDMQNAMERLRDVAHYVENQQLRSHQVDRAGNFCKPIADFDSLEFESYNDLHLFTQSLSEVDSDAEIMAGEFREVKMTFESLLRRQDQLNRIAQQNLMRIRMLPLSDIVSKLQRNVRTVAKKVGRSVQLNVVGEHLELDKTILDAITDPLLHLIRNAIDHGVEDATVRKASGKPEMATITLKAVNHGTKVSLRISDDGAGLDLKKIREKAIEKGLIEDSDDVAPDDLRGLIFHPGFSTAKQLTDVSGRGVGMDVVGDAIRKLNGSIRVDSETGVGTTFTIQLPTSIGLARAVMVELAGQTYAIPSETVREVRRFESDSVTQTDERPEIVVGTKTMPLMELSEHLQLRSPEDKSNLEHACPMLILHDGDDELAITVDVVLGSKDIVIKSLGKHLKRLRGFNGATLDGDGSVIPILDTTELFYPDATGIVSLDHDYGYCAPMAVRNKAMVIDDSISVRRVTESLLQFAGWDVVTAKDGVDALEQLGEMDHVPDIFLCDMEMPRMDGIEFIRQIREQVEFSATPAVMVTSRASEKHRHKAFESGATDYVVKPFNDEQLLELITRLVETRRDQLV